MTFDENKYPYKYRCKRCGENIKTVNDVSLCTDCQPIIMIEKYRWFQKKEAYINTAPHAPELHIPLIASNLPKTGNPMLDTQKKSFFSKEFLSPLEIKDLREREALEGLLDDI